MKVVQGFSAHFRLHGKKDSFVRASWMMQLKALISDSSQI